ncbi:hypothetical protein [Synechococcus sp. HK01-R]|uniref:hypothetical protein n=1 Tax=Synechococcus sp. HK01-R TaxID=2751171 RepID=UPI001626E99C|nr:hypothetical protein [Synechococcus sp. HK01-R]QNG26094.1 hypothetical protein H0O21_07180 [Synechococcus sp. HK01-R]
MPFIDTAIRQALNLAESCPSEEAIAAACQARNLQLRDDELKPVSKRKPAEVQPK